MKKSFLFGLIFTMLLAFAGQTEATNYCGEDNNTMEKGQNDITPSLKQWYAKRGDRYVAVLELQNNELTFAIDQASGECRVKLNGSEVDGKQYATMSADKKILIFNLPSEPASDYEMKIPMYYDGNNWKEYQKFKFPNDITWDDNSSCSMLCEGTRQHFNFTGDAIHYETKYNSTSKTMQIVVSSAVNNQTVDFAQMSYSLTGSRTENIGFSDNMTITNGVATGTISNVEEGDVIYFGLLYSLTNFEGNYQTMEGGMTPENKSAIIVRAGSCAEPDYVYFTNSYSWSEVAVYDYNSEDDKVSNWPGTQLTAADKIGTDADGYDIYRYAPQKGKVIFNNNQQSDASQTADLTVSGNIGKIYVLGLGDPGMWIDYADKDTYTHRCVRGSFNSWSYTANPLTYVSENTYHAFVELTGTESIQFGITNWQTFYKNQGTMTNGSSTDWEFSTDGTINCQITPLAGTNTYEFIWIENTHKLSVVYPVVLSDAPTYPTGYEACRIKSIWGTSYENLGWLFGEWGGGCTQTETSIAGHTMWQIHNGTNDKYFGLQYTQVDASPYQKFHIDVWTATAKTFNICLINNTNQEYGKKQVTTNAGSWTAIEIDNLTTATSVFQIKFDGLPAGDYYIADAYFFRAECPAAGEEKVCEGSSTQAGGGSKTTWTNGYDYRFVYDNVNLNMTCTFKDNFTGQVNDIYLLIDNAEKTSATATDNTVAFNLTNYITDNNTHTIQLKRAVEEGAMFTNITYQRGQECGTDESCPLQGQDLARSRPTTSAYKQQEPSLAVDGNDETRFESQRQADNPTSDWWQVELEKYYNLTGMRIKWEGAYSSKFKVLGSEDGTVWHELGEFNETGANDSRYELNGAAKYVRIQNVTYGSGYAMSFYTVEIYGCDEASCSQKAQKPTATGTIENGRIKLNLSAKDDDNNDITIFSILYNDEYYEVETTDGVSYFDIPSARNVTLKVYALNRCNQLSEEYATVEIGDYLIPNINYACTKTSAAGWSRTTEEEGGIKEDENNSKANDCNTETSHRQWSNGEVPENKRWWAVDLGEEYKLKEIKMLWKDDGNTPRDFDIQIALTTPSDFSNGQDMSDANWFTLKEVRNANITLNEYYSISFTEAESMVARYVRLVNKDNTRKQMYLYEFEVYVYSFGDSSHKPTISTATTEENECQKLIKATAKDYNNQKINTFYIIDSNNNCQFITSNEQDIIDVAIPTTGETIKVWAFADGLLSNEYKSVTVPATTGLENLALNKTAHGGANDNNANQSNNGNLEDRWGSGENSNQNDYWYVDLGDEYQLREVDIFWENAYSNHFYIQARSTEPTNNVSDEGWTTIKEVMGSQNATNQTPTETNINRYAVNGAGRYVRIKSLSNATQYGISMWEVRVYGCALNTVKIDKAENATQLTSSSISIEVAGHVENKNGVSIETTSKFVVENTNTSASEVLTATDGKITVTGLQSCVNYTLRVYARSNSGGVSAEYIDVQASTTPSQSDNIARGATATAGMQNENAGKAVDNDPVSMWDAGNTDANTDLGVNTWLSIDLGATYNLDSVNISWGQLNGGEDLRHYPHEWKLETSLDGTNFAKFNHGYQQTAIGQPARFGTSEVLPARYVRLMIIRRYDYVTVRDVVINPKAECYTDDGLPVITWAKNVARTQNTADIEVSALMSGVAADQFDYVGTLRNNTDNTETEINIAANQLTNGVFQLTGLSKDQSYTLTIKAKHNDKTSANQKVINFTTSNRLDLCYFTEERFDGEGGVWKAASPDENHRFMYTDIDGVFYFEHTIAANLSNVQYKLYDYYSLQWADGNNLFFCGHGGETVKMYAKGQNQFVSNFDHLYVAGRTIGDTGENWDANKAVEMTFDGDHLFYWTGAVTANSQFKIIVKDFTCENNTSVNWDRIMRLGDAGLNERAEATYDREWEAATLYFDMQTWTWWWENADRSACVRQGGAGSGLTDSGGELFPEGTGYHIDTYVKDNNLCIEAYKIGEGGNAVDVEFTTNAAGAVSSYADKKTSTQKTGYTLFSVPTSDLEFKPLGVVRYRVKFEVQDRPGVVRWSDYHYYNIEANEGKGECAPDVFIIYHRNQTATEGKFALDTTAVESFEGGQIAQPIEYRRRIDQLDTWYSLSLPFEVTEVTIYDEEDDAYYEMKPFVRKDGKYYAWDYIIRHPQKTEALEIDKFDSHTEGWLDPTDSNFKPQKNTPYIFQIPTEFYEGAEWYIGKYLAFFGGNYQTIESEFSAGSGSGLSDETANIYANNTMHSAQVGTCYKLGTTKDRSYYWWRQEGTQTIYPFESYLMLNEKMTKKYFVIRRGDPRNNEEEDDLPDYGNVVTRTELTQQPTDYPTLQVFSVGGQLIATFNHCSVATAAEQLRNNVTDGIYIVTGADEPLKIVIFSK